LGRARRTGQIRDNDHGSVLATRAAKKIDAGEFEYKITGQGYGGKPHNLAAVPIFRMP